MIEEIKQKNFLLEIELEKQRSNEAIQNKKIKDEIQNRLVIEELKNMFQIESTGEIMPMIKSTFLKSKIRNDVTMLI
jgi:hypothetical protein